MRATPAAVARHPNTIGARGPLTATHRPANTDATTRATAIGTKSTATPYPDVVPTSCRYSDTKKKMQKVAK